MTPTTWAVLGVGLAVCYTLTYVIDRLDKVISRLRRIQEEVEKANR